MQIPFPPSPLPLEIIKKHRERSKRLIIPYLSRSNVPDSGWHGIELPLRSSHTCRRLRRSPSRFIYVNLDLEREKGALAEEGGGRVRKSTIIPSFLTRIYIYISMPNRDLFADQTITSSRLPSRKSLDVEALNASISTDLNTNLSPPRNDIDGNDARGGEERCLPRLVRWVTNTWIRTFNRVKIVGSGN